MCKIVALASSAPCSPCTITEAIEVSCAVRYQASIVPFVETYYYSLEYNLPVPHWVDMDKLPASSSQDSVKVNSAKTYILLAIHLLRLIPRDKYKKRRTA